MIYPNWPNPERFRNYADAEEFIRTRDPRLCVPIFIKVEHPDFGKGIMVNPEYSDAPYEQSIIWDRL